MCHQPGAQGHHRHCGLQVPLVSPQCSHDVPGIPGASCDPLASRQSPHILRKGRRRMLVEVELENREENAYNASLWLHLPRNLHFSSLVLQVQPRGGPNS